MPGITMIGHSRGGTRDRFTSLPAEARSACRWLRLLHHPELASDALSDSLSQYQAQSQSQYGSYNMEQHTLQVKSHLKTTLSQMGKHGWSHFKNGEAENRMALALHHAVKNAAKDAVALSPLIGATTTEQDNNNYETTDDSENDPRPAPTSKMTKKKKASISKTAVVSDSSSAGEDECTVSGREQQQTAMDHSAITTTTLPTTTENSSTTTTTALIRDQAMRHCWAVVLESIHLQVASRTTRVWGKKKIYEVYDMRGPASPVPEMQVTDIRRAVEHEFRSVFHGGTEDQSGCRVYAMRVLRSSPQQDTTTTTTTNTAKQYHLYIQINIGKPFDYQDERNRARSGEKKKKKGNEFLAIVSPGSSLVALTASRAPSNSRYTPFVMSALEAVLANNSRASTVLTKKMLDVSVVPKRFGEWTGTEPLELLKSAQDAHDGQAVGRFANLAAESEKDGSSDPLLEMNTVSTENLVDRSQEDKRLATGRQHGRHIAQLQQRVEGTTTTTMASASAAVESSTLSLIATTKNGNGVLVDHSAGQKAGRKRARDEELGRQGDCPRLQRVAWKWTGDVTAAASCWMDAGAHHSSPQKDTTTTRPTTTTTTTTKDTTHNLPKTKFKCGIVMEGPNVFEGLRAMVAAGLAQAPLPNFVRDAPTLGSSIITVDHGEYGGTDAFATV